MELHVLEGDWGLPSVDYECLAVLAYCKFSDVQLSIIKSNNLWKSPTGKYPLLQKDDLQKTSVTSIFDYLREQNWGTDFDLTSKQCADIVAVTALLHQKLQPALEQVEWADSRTYTEFTRPWYAKRLPFPVSWWVLPRRHKAAVARLSSLTGEDILTDEEREAKIINDAKECLNLLSARLGNQDFFFGNMPTSLDAVVFGYLAQLLKVPYPNRVLQNHLKGCPNLCKMCNRILEKYFPLSKEEQEAQKKKEEEASQQQQEAMDFPNRKRNMLIAALVALTTMVAYAAWVGIIKVKVTEEGREMGRDDVDYSAYREYMDAEDQFDDDEEEEGEQE